MSIETRRNGTGGERVVLVTCPACGRTFHDREHRHNHIAEHDPEDFGLTPISSTEASP